MQENNQLTVPDNSQVNAHLATLTAEAVQAVREVWTLTEQGADQEAIDNALVAVTDHVQSLVEFGQQATAIISGLTEMVTAITERSDRLAEDVAETQEEIAALRDQVDELDEELEDRARDLAESMTQSEIEYIMQDPMAFDSERTNWLAQRMIDEGVDAVKEEQRGDLDRQLREAEDAALHEMGYGDTMPLFEEEAE